jgi:hypothetical protein
VRRDADLKFDFSGVVARETVELPLRNQLAHFWIDDWKSVAIRQKPKIPETQVGRNFEISTLCASNRLGEG